MKSLPDHCIRALPDHCIRAREQGFISRDEFAPACEERQQIEDLVEELKRQHRRK